MWLEHSEHIWSILGGQVGEVRVLGVWPCRTLPASVKTEAFTLTYSLNLVK